MNKIVIIGGGGFGREVQWLIERINAVESTWNIIGYIDDDVETGTIINGISVLGGIDYLFNSQEPIAATCAIGASATRRKVIEEVKRNPNITFPNLIDPSVLLSDTVQLGQGAIICAGNIITVNIEIDDFVIINLDCTIGHDAKLSSYVTIYPSVNVSGNVFIGEATELGTGAQIIQGKNILNDTIVGAGALVVKDLPAKCTAVGSPAKPIKFFE